MHSWWLAREGIEEARSSAELHPKLLRSADGAMPRDLLLAPICQAAAMSAREYRGVAQV
jgi:hypothetical protein